MAAKKITPPSDVVETHTVNRFEMVFDSIFEFAEYFWEAFVSIFRRFANWRLVRLIAELQILTRVSYVMLIVVPMLAALWPTVRIIVNQHGKAVADAAAVFEKSATQFNLVEQLLGARLREHGQSISTAQSTDILAKLDSVAGELKDQVARYKTDYADRSIESPILPRTFAAAFFAALAAVLGHTLYQMRAPEFVRKMTLDQFVLAKKEDYAKHPTPTALEAAQDLTGGEYGVRRYGASYRTYRRLEELNSVGDIRGYLQSMSSWEQTALKNEIRNEEPRFYRRRLKKRSDILRVLEQLEKGRSAQVVAEIERQKNMAAIQEAAEVTYLNGATKAPFAIIGASLAYGFALYLICTIIMQQTISVMKTTGIDSPTSIVEWWIPRK